MNRRYFRPRHIVVALLIAGVVTVAVLSRGNPGNQRQGSPPPPTTVLACTQDRDFLLIPGEGLSCFANGLFHVKLRNGTVITTHGPDKAAGPVQPLTRCVTLVLCPQPTTGPTALPGTPAPSPNRCLFIFNCLSSTSTNTTSSSNSYSKPTTQCVDPSRSYHVEMIYAHWNDADHQDNYASWAPGLQQSIGYVDTQWIDPSAQRRGSTRHYSHYEECDSSGKVIVHDASLKTPFSQSNFGTIVSDLQADGFAGVFADYWVFTDGNPTGYSGQGEMTGDDKPGVDNATDHGPLYAVGYGVGVFAHEGSHNMGAVNLSAPHSTGAYHCNDSFDVMCYDDGGPHGTQTYPCGDANAHYYDCNNDDYFDPNPPSGSYLATHWNIASDNNYWLLIR